MMNAPLATIRSRCCTSLANNKFDGLGGLGKYHVILGTLQFVNLFSADWRRGVNPRRLAYSIFSGTSFSTSARKSAGLVCPATTS